MSNNIRNINDFTKFIKFIEKKKFYSVKVKNCEPHISKYVNYESSNGRTDWPPSHDSRSYKVAFTKLKDLIGGKFIDLNKGIRRLYERNRTV